jgi:hypothetical protein
MEFMLLVQSQGSRSGCGGMMIMFDVVSRSTINGGKMFVDSDGNILTIQGRRIQWNGQDAKII